MRYCFLFLSLFLLQTNNLSAQHLLVRTDFTGSVTEGQISDLIAAIQSGAKIRVGWQHDVNYFTTKTSRSKSISPPS